MLIALEGIDGCGKTETVRRLHRKLLQAHVSCSVFDKHQFQISNAFASRQMNGLKNLIWPENSEPDDNPMGTEYYLFLLAAWYAGLASNSKLIPSFRNSITLIDGTFFRVIAKAHIRGGYPLEWLHTLFGRALRPDITILLNTPPELCWSRRAHFKATEIGRWDGFDGDAKTSYCLYQEQIGHLLLQTAKQKDWYVISPSSATGVEEVVSDVMMELNLFGSTLDQIREATVS